MDNKEELVALINNSVKEAINGLKNDIISEISVDRKRSISHEVTETITKKVKENEIPDFKKTYNKKQYEHNNKVKQALTDLEEAYDKGDDKMVREKLTEGKKLLDKRMKLKRIADREEDGWEVAKCYLSDTLADDSDDERRIVRSRRQAAANKKRLDISKRNKTYTSKFYKPYNSKIHESSSTKSFFDKKETSNFRRCYMCGETGHFVASCPRNFKSK